MVMDHHMSEQSSFPIGVIASALSNDAREAAKASRALGFAGLLFEAYSPAMSFPDLSGTGRREFLRVLSGADQRLIGLQGDVGPKGFGPGADVDRVDARLRRAMEGAGGLNAPLLCLEVGPVPLPPRAAAKPKPPITPGQAGLIILPTAGAGLPV